MTDDRATGFDPAEHPRDHGGRFTEKGNSDPEVTLGARALEPSDRVIFRGAVLRVHTAAADTLVLTDAAGGKVVALSSQVLDAPEKPEEREVNLALERRLRSMHAAVKGAFRAKREALASVEEVEPGLLRQVDERVSEALEPAGRYRLQSTLQLAKPLPLGAQLAFFAVAAEEDLTDEQFDALTAPWRRVLGRLPE